MRSLLKANRRSSSTSETSVSSTNNVNPPPSRSTLKTPTGSPTIPQAYTPPKKLLTPIKNFFSLNKSPITPDFSKIQPIKGKLKHEWGERHHSSMVPNYELQVSSMNNSQAELTSLSSLSNSSKFSFENDFDGGRNTSVKYYKQKKFSGHNNEMLLDFNDELADYDFENNGLEDFDEDENDFEAKYNNIYSSDSFENSNEDNFRLFDLSAPIINGLTVGNQDDLRKSRNRKFNIHQMNSSSLELLNDLSKLQDGATSKGSNETEALFDTLSKLQNSSVDPVPTDDSEVTPKFLQTPELEEDIYQEEEAVNRHNGKSNGFYSNENKAQYFDPKSDEESRFLLDTLARLEEKDTIGLGIKIQPLEDDETLDKLSDLEDSSFFAAKSIETKREPEKRNSILDLMNTLKNLETENTNKRDSIMLLMNTLTRLESEQKPAEKRQSIIDLMSTLQNLELESSKKKDSVHKEPEANGTEVPQLTKKEKKKSITNFLKENFSLSFDEEFDDTIIDEINQLPLDFDFDDVLMDIYNSNNGTESTRKPSFKNSSSYKKKPKKAVQQTSPTNLNKFEKNNKTVTLYATGKRNSNVSKGTTSNLLIAPISLQDLDTIRESDTPLSSPII